MDLKVLEEMRGKKVFKLFFLLLLNTAAMITTLYYLRFVNGTILAIVILFYLLVYGMICTIPKNFENHVKENLLPYLLKNIIKNDGEIKWQGEQFVIEESSPEETIIEDLVSYINKSCSKSQNKHDLDKYIEYLSEKNASRRLSSA